MQPHRCPAPVRYRKNMPFGVSTHLFLADRLSPAHLNHLQTAGAEAVELFASRHHFDYTERHAVRELANWFKSSPVVPTLHMPIFTEAEEAEWSRHAQPTLNLVSSDKRDRIEAMDEVKRALEAAEQIPLRSCVVHLGLRDSRWSSETLDYSLTAIEHLKAFAAPLGVQLLLENLANDLATPARLVEITRVGHFDSVGFCLDLGHAHMAQPTTPEDTGFNRASREQLREQWGDAALRDAIPEAFQLFGSRIAELHVHDNHGIRDEHLWPGDTAAGQGIDWGVVRTAIAELPALSSILEVAFEPATSTASLSPHLATARKLLES